LLAGTFAGGAGDLSAGVFIDALEEEEDSAAAMLAAVFAFFNKRRSKGDTGSTLISGKVSIAHPR
jgi:hypothetical protein